MTQEIILLNELYQVLQDTSNKPSPTSKPFMSQPDWPHFQHYHFIPLLSHVKRIHYAIESEYVGGKEIMTKNYNKHKKEIS